MSIFKDDKICAQLKRLATYRRVAMSRLENEALKALKDSRDAAVTDVDRIAKEEGPDSWNVFFSKIEIDEANEAISLLYELFILAAHKSIESHLVRLAKTAFVVANERDLHKFKDLKALYSKNGVALENVVHFSSINEIRLVANSVKHGGVVSKELAALPGWVKGQKLWNLDAFYDRVKSHIPLFIEHSTVLVEESLDCYVALSTELKAKLNAKTPAH